MDWHPALQCANCAVSNYELLVASAPTLSFNLHCAVMQSDHIAQVFVSLRFMIVARDVDALVFAVESLNHTQLLCRPKHNPCLPLVTGYASVTMCLGCSADCPYETSAAFKVACHIIG